MARIGLWSDSHNFPSLPLMKLATYHKKLGDQVEFVNPLIHYDRVYASKVFSFTSDIEDNGIIQTDEIVKGGTGYCIKVVDGKEVYDKTNDVQLPFEIEHIYPDYSLYPQFDYAAGFLTRGCPRNCSFCVVSKKEGRCSVKVADLSEFYKGEQKEIKLLDPNLIACKDHEDLLKQLAKSKAYIDFTQGIDIRLLNKDNINLLNKIKTKRIHFAWDDPNQDLTKCFELFKKQTAIKSYSRKNVYVLTNFGSTIQEDLYRIYTLKSLGYDPYVMIYEKQTADLTHKRLQRWVNNKRIFRTVDRFEDYLNFQNKEIANNQLTITGF